MAFALVSDAGELRRIQDGAPIGEPKSGWSWLPVAESTVNTATGPNPITVTTAGAVSGEWRIVHTTRDKTPEELDFDPVLGRGLKLAFNALFLLANIERQRHSLAALTMAQFRTAVEGMDDIDDTAFRDWLEGLS